MSANTEGGHEGEQPSSVELRLNPGVSVHIVGGLLVAFAGFALFRSAPKALTTIAVGSVFALALDPIVGVIRRNWGWPRSRSVLLVAGGAIVLVVTVVVGMGPQAVAQARKVTSDVPQTVREFYDLPVVGGWLEDNDAATRAEEAIEELPGKISDRSVTRTVEGMVGGALSTVLVLAVTVAVLLDGEYLVAAIRRLVPHPWVKRADEVGHVLYM